MKTTVKQILKEYGKLDLFTNERYDKVKEVMRYGCTKDKALKAYLSIDPYNKAQFIADHIVNLVFKGAI